MSELTHTVSSKTCPEAWVRAAEYLLDQPGREAYYLTLAVASPKEMTPKDFRVHDLVDGFLREYEQPPIASVAGTIFPANHYLREGAKGVFETFPETFSKLKKQSWGTYAMRMLRQEGKEGTIYPLQTLVTKLKKQLMRAAYEINLAEEEQETSFDLPVYRAKDDSRRLRCQPCLTHLSFKLYPGDALTLAVMYRSHYYASKTLGNLFGLAQLQSFVAAEVGLAVGPLICYSTHARIDTGRWKVGDIRRLVSACNNALFAVA
jgi:hypothetical protein